MSSRWRCWESRWRRACVALPPSHYIVALVVTVCAGLDLVLRGEARYHPTPDLFILPPALVVGATPVPAAADLGAAIVAGLAVFGALLFAVFWVEHVLHVDQMDLSTGEMLLTVAGYV